MKEVNVAGNWYSLTVWLEVTAILGRRQSTSMKLRHTASHIAHSASHIRVAYSVASHNRPRRLIDPLPISARTLFCLFLFKPCNLFMSCNLFLSFSYTRE